MLTGSLQGYQSFWIAQNRLDLALEAHVLQKPPILGTLDYWLSQLIPQSFCQVEKANYPQPTQGWDAGPAEGCPQKKGSMSCLQTKHIRTKIGWTATHTLNLSSAGQSVGGLDIMVPLS